MAVWSLLALSLPLALGAALSPMLFAATTGLLSQKDRPRRRALAFLLGALVPIGALLLVAFTAVGPLIRNAAHDADVYLADIDLALGVALLVVAGWFALRPPRRRQRAKRTTRPV